MRRQIERCSAGRVACFPWLVVGLVVAAGCGTERRFPVAGEVRFEGQPVEVGQITFEPATRLTADKMDCDIFNGSFEISQPDGLPAGEYRVRITAVRKRDQDSHEIGLAGPPPGLPEQYIPEQYNERTTLLVEVTPDGPNHFEFDLPRGE